ncbi:MAG: hypothetical protein NXY57DRAFT_1044624, partial [Lentinula lateritia]
MSLYTQHITTGSWEHKSVCSLPLQPQAHNYRLMGTQVCLLIATCNLKIAHNSWLTRTKIFVCSSPPATSRGFTLLQIKENLSHQNKLSNEATCRFTKSNTTAHIRADNTTKQYTQVIQRVRKWLEEFLKVEENAEGCLEDEDEDISMRNEEMASEFYGCLEGKPNQFTPEAIAMYISWKCYEEGRKLSTGESVHAAFKYHYTHLEGNKYRGDWRYDEGNKQWIGNPCNAAEVVDLMEGCKRKDGESERHHSKPASIIIMERLYAHSISVCPNDYPVLDAKSLAFKISHLRFRAYSSLGFTIWTRNTETSHLQAKHVERNPLPRPGATPRHRYNLYPQKIRAICAQTHLSIWMEFCEEYILRRQYEPNDYTFPTINANGVTFQSKQPITPEAVQKRIDNFTVAAGVPGAFTTHCFRRGGAQYRFMFAPIGECWTLACIQWWGGWAPNEK